LFEEWDIIGRIFYFPDPSFWELLKLNERWSQVWYFIHLKVVPKDKTSLDEFFFLDPHFVWLIIIEG
jgi:hypothetical protein